MTDLLIKNGTVITERGKQRLDIGVRDGKIAELAPALGQSALKKIDASDKLVFPGFIDAHTHMGIPIMHTHSIDDFASGSIAAACGGVTTFFDFTVQEVNQTLKDSVEARFKKAEGKSHVDFSFHVNITDEPQMRLWEIPEIIAMGLPSFKVFSTYKEAGMMVTWDEFQLILEKVSGCGGLLMLHAEENQIIAETMNTFTAAGGSARFHPLSRPPGAESAAIYRATEIAKDIGAALYIVHLSSWDGLKAGLQARAQGVDVILETCPQYLVLTEEVYVRENGHHWITTPPLRGREDREALWAALKEGQISVLGTDHCPFTIEQKESAGGVFHQTPNGLPGVETLFPLIYTHGVANGQISPEKMVELLAVNPAKIFGIYPKKGAIQIGSDADLVIWDPSVESVIAADQLHGKADWSPYEGLKTAGKITHTILRGQIIVQDGEFVGSDVYGEFVPASKLND